MSTAPINNNAGGNQVKSNRYALKTEDFIKMMVTQLQQQDPLEPAKNETLLTQMSQIAQMQSSTFLHDSIKSLVAQNNLGNAGALIGKIVEGLDETGNMSQGLVTSVRMEKGEVFLELDSGKRLALGRVTSISSVA